METPSSRTAAFFDLDLTLTRKDSFRSFVTWFYLRTVKGWYAIPGLIIWVLARKLRLISHKKFIERMLTGLSGMTQTEIHALGQCFFEDRLKSLLRPCALEKVRAHQACGDKVFILSGSPDIYVGAVSHYLGCDGYACTLLDMEAKVFTGKILGQICLAEEKPGRLAALARRFSLDLARSVAYSDHESDLPFFAFVGRGVAVSPTPALARIARARGWPVLFW